MDDDLDDNSGGGGGLVRLDNLEQAVEEAAAAVQMNELIMRHFNRLSADVRRSVIAFVTKPSRPQIIRPDTFAERGELVACARDLFARHQKLNRAKAFAQAIEAWKAGNGDEFKRWRVIAQSVGGFLDDYPQEEFEGRLEDLQHWAIARAAPVREGAGEQQFVADIQIHLPDDHDAASAPAIALLPKREGDLKYATDMGRSLLAGFDLRRVAVVSDICADDSYAHCGFASAARDAGIRRVEELNEGRKIPIDTVLAAVFSIKGLKKQDGGVIRPPLALSNLISLKIHTMSGKYPAELVWCLTGRNVPVHLDGDDPTKPPSELITDWEVCATTLNAEGQDL
jgi:hypothetical protein